MAMEERWYQQEADDACWRFLHETAAPNNGLICSPTGSGKSEIINRIVKRFMFTYPNTRIVMATHVKELIAQNAASLKNRWAAAPVGLHSQSLKVRDSAHPIIFGGVQSMCTRVDQIGFRHLMLIDEAHLLPPQGEARYQQFIQGLQGFNPHLRVIGLTATPFRLGSGLLYGPGQIFSHNIYDITGVEAFNRLISEGYLCSLIPAPTKTRLDISGVDDKGSDYNLVQLQNAVDKEAITRAALIESIEYGANRRSWLCFASGVNHCEHIAGMLNSMGISAVAIHSRMHPDERDRRVKAYKNGDVRCAVNFGVLTTGFDDPKTDMIIMLRPTKSPGLWVQMLGRGTRPYVVGGKRNCLVLDFARNIETLGPINDPVIPTKKRRGGQAQATVQVPIKICKTDNTFPNRNNKHGCGTTSHIQARFCINPECCAEFKTDVKIQSEASTMAFVKDDPTDYDTPIFTPMSVKMVFHNEYMTKGYGNNVIRVSYVVQESIKPIVEYVNLATPKGRQWWTERHSTIPPSTTKDALQYFRELRTPRTITVWENDPSGYPSIIRHEY